MDTVVRNRFEGCMFFVYDRYWVQKEEDLVEDAIVYFYPHSIPMDEQCLLCGNLVAAAQFSESVFDSYPVMFHFEHEKIAVKHVGKYLFALAGSYVEPDAAVIHMLNHLYFIFSFYHGSVDKVEMECDRDREKFIGEMRIIFEQYLAFVRNFGDKLPSVFNPVPYLSLNEDQNFYFLRASNILESCQRRRQVLGGALLYNRFILCSQFSESISHCLLLLKPNQQNHPAVPIDTDFQLPFGVRLFNVYLKKSELDEILDCNYDNSPYQQTTETTFDCSCTGHTTPRSRTPGTLPMTKIPEETQFVDNNDKIVSTSEKDPFSTSELSGSERCKAMLEDLILKGFKCCKCIEETDGELESIDGNILECFEEKKDDVDAITHRDDRSFQSPTSRNASNESLLETESGIEVTNSDFHSSAATALDQRYSSYRDIVHVTNSTQHLNFAGNIWQDTMKRRNEATNGQMMNNDSSNISISMQEKDTEGKSEMLECNEMESNPEETVNVDRKNVVGRWEGNEGLIQDIKEKESKDVLNGDNEVMNDCQTDSFEKNKVEVDNNLVTFEDRNATMVESTKTDNEKEYRISDFIPNTFSDVQNPGDCPEADRISCNDEDSIQYEARILSPTGAGEETYRTPDEILNTYEISHDETLINDFNVSMVLQDTQELHDSIDRGKQGGVTHVCKEGENSNRLGSVSNHVGSTSGVNDMKEMMDCEIDGLVHANLFVQAHSEIVLILLAKCDLYQNEDVIRSLWSKSLSELGDLDILMKNSSKDYNQVSQGRFNLLIYDNFTKTMSGNGKEPVFSSDHMFCETATTLHDHFKNASHLSDITLRNFHSGIHGERILSREVYYHETNHTFTSNPPNITGYLAEKMKENVNDSGLPYL